MRKWSALGLLALLGATTAQPAPKPRLIVAIAVDQFSADLFNEYRSSFTGGLRRLATGAVFPAGYQSHAATETCPGHSTILTGSRPARTGIIANDWMIPALERHDRAGKPTYDVYCAEAPGGVATDASAQVISPHFLRVPTLGDRLKAADPASRSVAVAGKDRAAVMMGGHNTDLTLWWNGKSFGTYADRDAKLGVALDRINARAAAAIAQPVKPFLPPACRSYARPVKLSDTASIGTLAPRKAADERAWRATPQFDAMTLDVALAATEALELGRGAATDVLAVSFSATDYTGHAFGTAGAEMCANMFALDAALGRFFSVLDRTGVDYAVVLTADHGGHDLPERNRTQGLPEARRASAALAAPEVGKTIAARFGLTGSALLGRSNFGDMYLAPTVTSNKRAAVRAAAVEAYRASPDVAAVFTRDELTTAPQPQGAVETWTLIERAKASFDPERSGDFVVLLKPYVTPIPNTSQGYYATHGSPWGYDRRVPILFWRKGMVHFEQPNGVETVDILPTLASLIGLLVPPNEIDGRCLDLIAGPEDNCAAR